MHRSLDESFELLDAAVSKVPQVAPGTLYSLTFSGECEECGVLTTMYGRDAASVGARVLGEGRGVNCFSCGNPLWIHLVGMALEPFVAMREPDDDDDDDDDEDDRVPF